jgi:hypothetical protein
MKLSKSLKGKNVGKIRTKKYKKHLSEICKGRKLNLSIEQLKKRSDCRKGKIHSKEWCKNISNGLKGNVQSAKSNKKRSESLKGRIP